MPVVVFLPSPSQLIIYRFCYSIAASITGNPSSETYYNIPRDNPFDKPIVCIKVIYDYKCMTYFIIE